MTKLAAELRPGRSAFDRALARRRSHCGEPSRRLQRLEIDGHARKHVVHRPFEVVAVQELTKAYQELASKNAKNLTAAMQALAAVKSPTEFMELQQRLIKEGVEAAVSDSQHIAQLTTAVFTAAFEPVKKQIEVLWLNGGYQPSRATLQNSARPSSASQRSSSPILRRKVVS